MTALRDKVRSLPEFAAAVTKHDTNLLTADSLIYVGGDGDVTVYTTQGSGPITFAGMSAGDILPVKCRRVMSTDTTATLMVAIW
ncbi:hypothetical protein KA005_50705 [bacterium]|nr:hypothetical protein [bacterium]